MTALPAVRLGRAAPLPLAERRAAIIAATLPLVRALGQSVTTRQIAAAAGIAEGTIFRVFADKNALIQAVIESAFDVAPLERDLAALPADAGLRDRVIAAIGLIEKRVVGIWDLMSALRRLPPAQPPDQPPAGRQPGGVDPGSLPFAESRARVMVAITALFEKDRAQLRCEPAVAAKLLRAMAFGGTHPAIIDGDPLSAEEIATVLLDGILLKQSPVGKQATSSGRKSSC